MLKSGTALFYLLITFISINLNAQEKVYIPYFSCEECDKGTEYAAAFMFADFVDQKGTFTSLLTQVRDSLLPSESSNEARESAELNSTKFYVFGHIVRLEGSYYIKVTLYATSSGLMFWTGSRQTSDVEDLPIILKDLASNMTLDSKWSKPGDIYLVNSTDGGKINRIHSNKSLGFIAGAMVPLSEKKIDHLNSGFGGLLSFDNRNFIFESSAEIYFGKDSLYDGYSYSSVNNRYYNLTMNAIYPLNTTNNAPFVCLGSGFSYRESEVGFITPLTNEVVIENRFDNGLLINGGGGYILKRNSDATFFVYARGYVYLRDFETAIYGVMLNFSMQIERW